MTASDHTTFIAACAQGAILMILAAPALAEDAPVQPGPEIVVSASRVPLPARETGAAVTVLTEKEIEERGTRVLADILRDVPGVAVSRTGPVGSFTQVRIRGAEGNQALVLIDGIEVNNPAGGSEFDFAHLLAADIARIEVLRGPQSALYGSDAVGGVINIVTKRPDKGWAVRSRGETGSFATRDGLGYIGYGDDRFYAAATYDRYRTNGISEADKRNGNDENDAYGNATLRLKAGFAPLKNLSFDVVGMEVTNRRETDDQVAVLNAIDGLGRSRGRQRYGLAKARLALLGGKWEHILRAAYAEDGTDFFDATAARTFVSEGQKSKFDYQTNLFFETAGSAHGDHTITLAAEREVDQQFNDSAFSGPSTVSVENYGYVAEYRVALWDRLFLSASLRFDDNDPLFKDETTWRGTFAYIHEPWNTRLHGSIGRGVKNPTLFELFGFTPTFTGNPNLSAEENIGVDLGVEHTMLGGRLIADVTWFRSRFTNFIDGAGNTATNLPGTTKADGFEVTLVARPTDRLKIDAAYTYTYARDADGVELIRRARHIASVNGTYAFSLADRPATANLGIRFNGTQNDTVFDSFFPAVRRTVALKGYSLLNAGFNWRLNDHVELFARGENLLDQHYQEVFGFGTPGIGLFAGLTVKFGSDAK